MKYLTLSLVTLALTLTFAFARTGEEIYQQSCANCHSLKQSPFPVLHGMPSGYLVKAMKKYKKGKRIHPLMQSFAAQLSNDEIIEVSSYLALEDKCDAIDLNFGCP